MPTLQAHSTQPVLIARNLVKSFGDLTAVAGIDLTVEHGECIALLGPNGAGKTTTVEMLEGLQTPTSGSIHIFAMDLARHRAAIMQRVGVLLQETNLYKRYTVRETLQLFGSFYDESTDPDAIIDMLNLGDKADTQLRKLSGGQKQRVYLGASLINDPQLLFLDEPTTGLDPQARRSIWELLEKLKAQHRSMLLTTHYMEEAERLADRVAIIDQGRVITQGRVRELINKYCGEKVVTITLTNGQNQLIDQELESAVAMLKMHHPVFAEAVCMKEHCEFLSASASTTISAIMDALRGNKFQIVELNLRSGSLEDVFIKLTGRSIRDA